MQVEPYLSFEGRCEEAIEFYKKALGAEVDMLMRMKDNPEQKPGCQPPPGAENKVMHSSLRIGDSRIMATDGQCTGKSDFKGITLSVSVANDAQAQRAFNALADGGKVHMPLSKTFFSSSFGIVADRFGVSWMVLVGQ